MDYFDPQFQEFLLAGETQYRWYFKQKLRVPSRDLQKTLDLLTNTIGILNRETEGFFEIQLHHQKGEPKATVWLFYSVEAPTRKAARVLSYGLTLALDVDALHIADVEIIRATTVVQAA